jgi:hypothetical protein
VLISPPAVSEPVYECSDSIEATGQFVGATVTIFSGGRLVAQGTAQSSYESFPLSPGAALHVGEPVVAAQQLLSDTSFPADPGQAPRVLSRPPAINPPDFITPTYACASCVRLGNVIKGATVDVGIASGGSFQQLGSAGAAADIAHTAAVGLIPPTAPGQRLIGRQSLCATSSAQNQAPGPATVPPSVAGSLRPPVIESPLYCKPTVLVSDCVVGATGGHPTQTFCATWDKMRVWLSPDLVPGEIVTVRQEIANCHPEIHNPGPGVSKPETVQPISPDRIATPQVFPMCAGDTKVYLDNLEPGARVSIYAGNEQIGGGQAPLQTPARFNVVRPLAENEPVRATQELCGTTSHPSPVVYVWSGYRDLPVPLLPDRVTECAGLVTVKNVAPGAWVDVFSQLSAPNPIGHALALSDEVDIPLYYPLTLKDSQIWAVIEGCHGLQARSNFATVVEARGLPTPFIECAVADQTWMKVGGVMPGALVDVYVDGVLQSPSTYAGSSETVIRGLSLLPLEHTLKVCQRACVSTPACSQEVRVQRRFPRYNGVYGVATHNSYWINRSDQVDFAASGAQELLSDQLLHERVRAIEIDVHSDDTPPGVWKVYHTSDAEDFLGRYLDDYLEYLRGFHYAIPQHEVINIIIEFKNVRDVPFFDPVSHQFSDDHTIDQFDNTFRSYLGPWLYTPADFFARAPGAATITDCAQAAGWPRIDELRGKFIVNVIGNWSTAAYDWVEYATTDIRNRVAFPMQSVFDIALSPHDVIPQASQDGLWFQVDLDGDPVWIRDIDQRLQKSPDIDPMARTLALQNSIFWQLEPVDDQFAVDHAKTFIDRGGIIRGTDAFEFPKQLGELNNGLQMFQTDYPWHIVNDDAPAGLGIPIDPSRRFRDALWTAGPAGPSGGHYREPGARFYAHTPFRGAAPGGGLRPATEIWAYTTAPDPSQRWWEVTVSSANGAVSAGHASLAQWNGRGSIRVSSADGQDSVVITRSKYTGLPDDGGPPLAGGVDVFRTEGVIVSLHVSQGGQPVALATDTFGAARYGPCKRAGDPNSDDVSSICVGSLIALSVDNRGGSAVVTAFSAGKMKWDMTPDWQTLGQWTFGQALTLQGFSAFSDVLFAGPRVAHVLTVDGAPALRPRDVKGSDVPQRQVINPDPAHAAAFVDASWSVFDECSY